MDEVRRKANQHRINGMLLALSANCVLSTKKKKKLTRILCHLLTVQKLQDAYEEKLMESEATKEYAKKKKNELELAKRLFKAKMNRFGKAVDSGKGDPTVQIERYYKAQVEMLKAEIKQDVVKSVVLEAQSAAWEALAKLREAEIKALRARAAA